ncbi:MAG: redoxin domain-containing protein [Bacteroidota bacterium]
MIRNLYFSFILLTLSFNYVKAQDSKAVKVIKFNDLENLINSNERNIKVINFWATWCKPCIKELPYFEALNKNYSDKNVDVTLISFDFVENLDGRVKTFLKKKNIQSDVFLLDETDFNKFIDKVYPSWSGAIPATIIVDNREGKNVKSFYEKEFHEGEVEQLIQEYFN